MKKDIMKPINNKKSYHRIVELIINLIVEGKLEYGEKLYNENEFLAILNVSRPTLREALRVLEFLGILTVTPRKGIVINNPSEYNEYYAFKYVLAFEKIKNKNLIELRMAIELEMIKQAAIRATDESLKNIKAILDDMNSLEFDDIAKFTELDHSFHMKIVESAGNPLCYKLMNTLSHLIYDQLKSIDNNLTNQEKENALLMHNKIYKAIANKDCEQAVSLLRDHLEHASSVIEKLPEAISPIIS